MRAEMVQATISGGFKGRVGLSSSTKSLKEGDLIRAEVLSSDKGAVTLKTSNGHILTAKMDANASFSPGDRVMLEVTAKENEIAQLSILREDQVLAGSQSPRHGITSGFEDRSLAPYAARLSQLNMPVNEETARAMRDLVTQNPRITLDQAAFIASNKLMANDGLLKAALALLSGGEKTDAMLLKLVDLLNTSNMSPLNQSGEGQKPTSPAPLMELFAQLNDNTQAAKATDGQNPQTLAEALKSIISQTDTILQSKNSMNSGQVVNNAQAGDKSPVQNAIASQISGQMPQMPQMPQTSQAPQMPAGLGQISASQPDYIQPAAQNQPIIVNSELPAPNPQIPAPNIYSQPSTLSPQTPISETMPMPMPMQPESAPAPTPMQPESAPAPTPMQPESAPALNAEPQTLNQAQHSQQIPNSEFRIPNPNVPLSNLHAQLTALLSELPEFRQTPTEALERFTSALIRVAGDSAQINAGDTEQLKLLLEKMFTRIERGDQDAGARLQNAREEMFTRLSFLEEAIMRASPAARAEMLEQTQRVMEHVRILNNIDQFVYMQLPVLLGNERKSAELYMFKKKGGKRVDPDNVNILLALDLQHMGHWEALLNIRNKDVSIKMDVLGAAEKEHFVAHTVLLHNMLAEADFKLVSTDISFEDEEKTNPLTALVALDRYAIGRAKKIDFTI